MFEHTSRYFDLETATMRGIGNRVISYKRRRILPPIESIPQSSEITVVQGERLDMISARHLGDPERFWLICDANSAMHPQELTQEIGRKLRIPMPQF